MNEQLLKELGDAINDALYPTPYNGKRNVPCLCSEQRIAAATAAYALLDTAMSAQSPSPSKYATVDVIYGEGKKRLAPQDRESFEFHATRTAAMDAVKTSVEGGSRLVALLSVEQLFRAAVAVELVTADR